MPKYFWIFFQFLKTYALKLAHLFTYYNYNYTLYTSQDCETFFTATVTEYTLAAGDWYI